MYAMEYQCLADKRMKQVTQPYCDYLRWFLRPVDMEWLFESNVEECVTSVEVWCYPVTQHDYGLVIL